MIPEHIITAIAGERAYQEKKWPGHRNTVGEWVLIIIKLVGDAHLAWVTKGGATAALHEMRQLAATCIACMEQHGAVYRGEDSLRHAVRESLAAADAGALDLKAMTEERDHMVKLVVGLKALLTRVSRIVKPEAMFEKGEDPHPPSFLELNIDEALDATNGDAVDHLERTLVAAQNLLDDLKKQSHPVGDSVTQSMISHLEEHMERYRK